MLVITCRNRLYNLRWARIFLLRKNHFLSSLIYQQPEQSQH